MVKNDNKKGLEEKSAKQKDESTEKQTMKYLFWLLLFGFIALFSYIFIRFEFELRLGPRWDLAQWMPSMPGVLALLVFLSIGAVVTFLTRRKKRLFSSKELAAVYIALSVCGVVWQVGWWLPLALGSLPLTLIEDSGTWGPVLDAASSLLFPLQTVEEAEAFYWGGMTAPFRQWFVPILLWSMYAMAIGILCVSLSILVRRHWMQAMQFSWPYMTPIVTLAEGSSDEISMKDTRSSRLFIIGVAIGFVLIFLEWLKGIYPWVPFFSDLSSLDGAIRTLSTHVIRMVPFHAREPLHYFYKMDFHPSIFGVAYLVPLNMIGSFIAVSLGKYVIAVGLAMYDVIPNFPAGLRHYWSDFFNSIVGGGMIALAVVSLYRARTMIKEFITMSGKDSYEQEGISSRAFLVCITGSLLYIILFMMIGLHLPILLVLCLLFISICWSLATARFRAEVGLPVTDNPTSPTRTYLDHLVGGLGRFGGPFYQRAFLLMGERVFATFFGGGMSPLTGHSLDAYKLGEGTGLKTKYITRLILVVTAFTILVAFYSGFPFLYSSQDGAWGARAWAGWQGPVSVWRYGPMFIDQVVDWNISIRWSGLAFIIGILAIGLRGLFSWWPLHPVGALLGVSDWTYQGALLLPFIAIGIVKFVIFRYFGVKTYQAAKPLFIGLIIGPVIGRIVVIILQFLQFIFH